MKHHENLSKVFDIELPAKLQAPVPVVVEEPTPEITEEEDDFQLARRTMRRIIEKSDDTLDDVLELARDSEHPRTYEVAGQLMKTMSEVSRDLLELHKQKKEIRGPQQTEAPTIGQQNVFVGTTQEMLAALRKQKNDDNNTFENNS